MPIERRLCVVIGGGIGGLAAAHFAAHDPTRRVLVLEGSADVGGKLTGQEVGGVRVDVGAEAMLNRRPEGVALTRALGLTVVHPEPATSRIWSRGALRPLPRSLMGVPLDADGLAQSGILSVAGLARAQSEREAPTLAPGEDISVGDLVAQRLGDEVVDRLVEPLLGGVYAGRAHELSVRATVPALAAFAERGSLMEQAAALPAYADEPVFAGIRGGMFTVVHALVAQESFEVRRNAVVRELRRQPIAAAGGFALTVGSATNPELIEAAEVIVAVPPAAAARLLATVSPGACAELAQIEAASMAVITLALRARDLGSRLDAWSGFLVPPIEDLRIKASTFSFAKWAWVREAGRDAGAGEELLIVRTSVGRHREERSLQVSDEELIATSLKDLGSAVGIAGPVVDAHVQRWGGGLPQYAVGHLERVDRIRAAVAAVPGLAVCGAAYDGVGIPAVIGSAQRAADRLAADRPATPDRPEAE